MQSLVLAPGAGETITALPERDVVIKASHELVDVTEVRYAPGERGPDPHVHRRHADAFYVLEGELTFGLGPDVTPVSASAGTLVIAPPEVVHTFGNESSRDARYLNVHAPSAGFAESLRLRRDGGDVALARFDSYDPPADGGRPLSDAVVRRAGEGDTVALGASTALFKAQGADGDGTFSLTEVTLAPAFRGPVPHRHEELVDSFYVLEGTAAVRVGDEVHDATAGSYVFVPPGTVHTFSNRSGAPVRLLDLMAPGGFEQYLEEVAREAAASGRPPSPETMARIASAYDFHPA